MAKNETVMVVVRMRPFNTKEKTEKRGPCIHLDVESNQCAITNPAKADAPPKSFTFDAVFGADTQQKNFYEDSCYQLIESVMVRKQGRTESAPRPL
jgi:kinesin family protein 3/17